MRDPARIARICMQLEVYWQNHPDLRLCQIIGNFLNEHLGRTGLTCPEMSARGYNVEDHELHAYLIVKNMGPT